ncbi:MAG: hypothetical protein ACI9KE_004253 [Polyangiales bacterium]|jgi:hypothetical protein
MKHLALAVLFCTAAFAPSLTSAQGLELTVRNGFNTEGSAFVLVDVINRSSRETRGTLELAVNENSGGQRFRIGADVPPRDRRTFQFETGLPTGSLKVRLRENDRVIAEAEAWQGGSAESVIVLADPPRVQASTNGLTGSRELSYGSEAFDYVVGTVDFDAAGDPVVPRQLQGWRGVGLVIASVRELERLDEAQLEALRQHVFSGGRILISPSSPEEVRAASVQRLAGDVRVVGEVLVSSEALWQPEYFGGGRALGFGYVWLCTKDINAPSSVGSTRVGALLRRIVQRSPTVTPQLPLYDSESTNNWESRHSFRELRAALDPNASFRPALGVVAVLLLIYVLAVGPLNFSYVQKRGKPTLALITTPILSFGCLVLMLLVGFIGKGVTMRHRSITWVESLAGESQGIRRTYRGLYSTRPATFDLEAHGITAFAGNSSVMLTHDIGPSGDETLVGIRASLWSTTLLREEEIVRFGGVDFSLQDGELESVTNRGEEILLGGLIVGSGGRAFEIGDVGPGETVSIPATPSYFASPGGEGGLARSLGFDEDEEEIVGGQLRLVGVMAVTAPVFFARVEHSDGTIALFAEEHSATLVSVQAPAQEFPVTGGHAGAWLIGTGPLTDEPTPMVTPSDEPIGLGLGTPIGGAL